MLTISFQTAVIAIAQIFSVWVIGFMLVRRHVIDEQGLKLLSFLSVNICFPFFIFYQITHYFNPQETAWWWGYPLINISLILTGLSISTALFFILGRKPKDEFLAAASMHNAGYIPILLAMSLPLGEVAGKVYAAIIISIIGFDCCLWSIGVWLMTRHQQASIDVKRMLNPPLISMGSAILLVLCFGNNPVPEIILKPVKVVGDSAMALAMIVIGGNLAKTNFKKLHFKKIAGAVMIKLLVLPFLALAVLVCLHLNPVLSFVVMVQSCMPTAITLSIIGRHHESMHQDFINQGIFFSHLLCLVTVPVFLAAYGMWVH